jgi:hypothetical protein
MTLSRHPYNIGVVLKIVRGEHDADEQRELAEALQQVVRKTVELIVEKPHTTPRKELI